MSLEEPKPSPAGVLSASGVKRQECRTPTTNLHFRGKALTDRFQGARMLGYPGEEALA